MSKKSLLENRRKGHGPRKHDYRQPKANSFLIVTEGARTEPYYFGRLKELIHAKMGGVLDVVAPDIDIQGRGQSTIDLLKVTEKIVRASKIVYQNIWIVFDKDDFENFDEAIKLGEAKGYHIAWSNRSFEYWLYLHFHYNESAINDWAAQLDTVFKQEKLGQGRYRKNNKEDVYAIVNRPDRLDNAIKNAKHRKGKDVPSTFDPGTTVYKLVEELKKYLDE